MKSFILECAIVVGVTQTLPGCQQSNPPPPQTAATPSLADELGVSLPTQEEADAAAAEKIRQENADRAFEELQKEIDDGG